MTQHDTAYCILIAGNPPPWVFFNLAGSLTKNLEAEDPLEAPGTNASRGVLFLRVLG